MITLNVEEDTLAKAWEVAVVNCWEDGTVIETQYDNPGDPPSKDVTLMLRVANPFTEPRLHMGGMCMGWADLEKYRAEVLYGVSDWRVGKDWDYTYHERFTAYSAPGPKLYNQVPQGSATVRSLRRLVA